MFSKSHFSKITIISFALAVAVSLTFVAKAQDIMRSPQYRMEDSYFEIQETSPSQIISLSKEEDGEEEVVSQVMIVDNYLISGIPENEFLNEYSRLQSGFQDLKISIEVDQPLFKKENFYHPLSFWEKTKSLFGFEILPEYRLIKEVRDVSGNLETDLKIPGLDFKTSYGEADEGINNVINKSQKIKQNLFFKNNSDKEINLQLTLSHSLEASKIIFGGEEYLISENPQFLSPQISNSVSFSSEGQQYFTYDFSDLLEFNPEVWVFRKGSQDLLLVKIYLSLLPHSSIIIDPSYTVGTSASANATAYSFQRKTWWDGSRYWTSLWDGYAELQFYYSDTGENWTQNENATFGDEDLTNDFSIIGDSENAFIVYSDGTNVYARQTWEMLGYPGTDWMWDDPYEVFTPTPPFGESCIYPHMNRDSSNYIWAIIRETDAFVGYSIKVRRSVYENDISEWEEASTLDASVNSNKYGVIVPQGSEEEMYAIWIDDATIEGKRYDGLDWDEDPTWILDGVSGLENSMSVVHDTSNYYIHLTCLDMDGWVIYLEFTDSWNDPVVLDNNNDNRYTTISINTSNNDLYAFWERTVPPTNKIFYKKGVSPYGNTDWDKSATEWQATTWSINWVTSNYSDNDKIYGIWTQETAIEDYDIKWAEVSLAPPANATPTVGTVILNGGGDITLTENTTTAVSATATVTDTDGCTDITSVEGGIYEGGTGVSCSANDNNCYLDSSCATSSCDGNSCTATCDYDVWFYATPTDVGMLETTFYWGAWIIATDGESTSTTATTGSQELDIITLRALDVSTISIDYGTLNPGQNTGTLNQTTTVTTTGNAAIDIYLYGTNMGSTTSGWYDTEWLYRKKITIDNTKVDDDLTDFPVLVATTADSDLVSYAQSDGDDILFTSSDGTTKLSHEIELYASSTGELVAWVKSDLASTTDTEIYMYYGSSAASDQQQATSVWDNNYMGVWHMNASSDSNQDDSSGRGHTLTVNGAPTSNIDGKIGKSITFDSINDYFTHANHADFNFGAGNFTLAVWGEPTADAESDWRTLMYKGSATCRYNFVGIRKNAPVGGSHIEIDDDSADKQVNNSIDTSDGNWHFYVAARENDALGAGHDELRNKTDSTLETLDIGDYGSIDQTDKQFALGSDSDGNGKWKGDIDEIRISNIARSAAWISTSYNNQTSTSDFLSFGGQGAGNIIPVENQEWSTNTSISYGSGADATSSTNYAVELDLSKPTSHPSTSTDEIYWGLAVPVDTPGGTYNGTNTAVAKAD